MPSLEGDTTNHPAYDSSPLKFYPALPQDRFNVPYTHCGCPLPGKTIGQKLSQLVRFQRLAPPHLVPPPKEDLLAATHPSDHNTVHRNRGLASWHRDDRLAKLKKRQARDAALVQQGKLKTPNRSCAYETPFLIPVPLSCRRADADAGGDEGGECVGENVGLVLEMIIDDLGCSTVRFQVDY